MKNKFLALMLVALVLFTACDAALEDAAAVWQKAYAALLLNMYSGVGMKESGLCHTRSLKPIYLI